MKILNLYAWEGTDLEKEDRICADTFDEINFYYHDEIKLHVSKTVAEHINHNNIKVNVLTISTDELYVKKCLLVCGVKEELINVSLFPLYWILKTHIELIEHKNKYYLENTQKETFTRPFLSFNGRGKEHRCKLIDILYSKNLLDDGVVTFHGNKDLNYDWKYYDGNRIEIEGPVFSSYIFDESFIGSFLHIPTESEVDVIAISEKTVIPILNELPFLVLGAHKFHAYLKDLGFKLYDEVFDYSFDDEENLETRVEKLVKNIEFVVQNKEKLNELYSILKPKLEFNKQHALNLVKSINCVPDMLKKHYYNLSKQSNMFANELVIVKNFNFFDDTEKVDLTKIRNRTKKLYYNYWHNFSYNKIVDDINEQLPEEIVIFGEQEWEVWVTEKFVNTVNEKNIKVSYTTAGVVDEKYLERVKQLGIHNIKVESWNTFYFRFAAEPIRYLKDETKQNTFRYPFICLNNRGHLHRCYVIDFITEYGLLNKGKVSWTDPKNESSTLQFKFNYFDGNLIDLDDMKTKQDSYIIPNEYYETFFDFVTEATYKAIVISEKTIKPLVFKKPFAVMGAVGFHKHLQNLGFKLYDEIIDYSFDDIEDLELRAKLYVENIKRISELKDFDSVYNTLIPKLEHNYDLCFKLVNSSEIPNEVKKILPIVHTNPYENELGCLARYKYLIGGNKIQ